MRNRSIDADYKIEAVYESRRVGKVMEILGEIVQLNTARRTSRLHRRRTFLQRDKLYPRYFAKRRQRVEGDRAATIVGNLAQVARSPASPAQSNPQTGKTGKPLAPVSNIRRVCRQIGRRRRNGF